MTNHESHIPDPIHPPIVPQAERFDLGTKPPIEGFRSYPLGTPDSPYASLTQRLDSEVLARTESVSQQFKADLLNRVRGACGMAETVERPTL